MMKIRKINTESGFATFIALMVMAMLTLIGLAAMSTSDDEVSIAGNQLQEMRAFVAAEAGLNKAAAELHQSIDTLGSPAYLPAGHDSLNNCIIAYTTTADATAYQRGLTNGTLEGLNGWVKTYLINSIGVSKTERAQVEMSETFQAVMVPVYQYSAFYDNDLELAAGSDLVQMERMHANGALYLQSVDSLKVGSFMTAVGSIFHGRKGPGVVETGDIYIADSDDLYVSMAAPPDYLDANDAIWFDETGTRWGGRVQDAAHNQDQLAVMLTGSTAQPHDLIERATGNPNSYELRAGLKLINGEAIRRVGAAWDTITTDLTTAGIMVQTSNQFRDKRDNKWVTCTELDLGLLFAGGWGPDNGVIYCSDQVSVYGGFRLKNGATLGRPLTVACENPLYTLGDFNSINKQPAALIADAVTILSNNWLDANSNLATAARVATSTTVNAAIVAGNIETTVTTYNGGLENLPRLLETWSMATLTWTGSLVCLWNSEQANTAWSLSHYDPPTRNWAYDTTFNDPTLLPPAPPVVRVFQRVGWSQKFVGIDQNIH